MAACLIYVTTASEEEALSIGRILVKERLAACVNIHGSIRSLFRWDGKIQEEQECAFIAKTTEAASDALTKRILELHSYECPCVVKVPVTGGNDAFLKWIEESLKR